jgi:hypothetical protein
MLITHMYTHVYNQHMQAHLGPKRSIQGAETEPLEFVAANEVVTK